VKKADQDVEEEIF